MTRTEKVRTALGILPKGVLVSIIITLLGALGTMGYAGGKFLWSEHKATKAQLQSNSEELRDLITLTENMVRVIEYNSELAEENETEIEDVREKIHAAQLRVERILARVEARLDNER